MPTPSLSQLVAAKSADELKTTLLSYLAPDFPVDDWHEGSVERTLVEIDAKTLEEFTQAIAAIAKGGLLDEATGPWLTLLASNFFALTRTPAAFERQTVVLTDAASAGPFTILPGQLWFVSNGGRRFSNRTGGTLANGGTLSIEVQAESPGAAWRVVPNEIRTLLTPLPGVTVTNTARTQAGADEEKDPSLRQRCRDRWAELGTGGTAGAYRNWAKQASPSQVTRVVAEPDGVTPGRVNVRIAGSDGEVTSDVVNAVNAFIQPRRPLTVQVVVSSVTNVKIPITATLRVKAAYRAAAEAAMEQLLADFLRGVDIGGTVYRSAIIETLMGPEGMLDAVLSAPTVDTALTSSQAAALDADQLNLTWIEV